MKNFLQDVTLPGCILQIGSENTVAQTFDHAADAGNLEKEVRKLISFLDCNLYFLGGVKPEIGKNRANDNDVLRKNYVYFDFDYRKLYPNATDAEIKDWAHNYLIPLLTFDETFARWRYVVFTGNGLHLYYFSREPLIIIAQRAWKMGMREMVKKLEALTKIELDHACVNIARIARLPGSFNHKNTPPKPVEIIARQDEYAPWMVGLEALGGATLTKMEEENRLKAQKVKTMFPLMVDTYKAIQSLPIQKVVCMLFGWETDGKHFFEPGSQRKSGCFVPEDENYLVHGGTGHIPPSQVGYRSFELVKAVKKFDNTDVFFWFKDHFPEVKAASERERKEKEKVVAQNSAGRGDIRLIFDELKRSKFEQLTMGHPVFDSMKFVIRGAVTRMGAYSNIGKSKLLYFFSDLLLNNGHKGLFFSTEVTRHIVLANFLTIHTGFHFWDIINKEAQIEEHHLEKLSNLEIYDVTHTQNNLKNMETLIQRSIDEAERDGTPRPDFVAIDFCQGVTPSVRTDAEYMQMSKYAFEVQSMAQRLNVAVIDLSQISNDGVRDEFANVGMIPFKGSGHLYSSADIGIILKRDKKNDPSNDMMSFDIRKHKYLPPSKVDLVCNFSKGTFSVFGSEFADRAPTVFQALTPNVGGIH